MDRDVNTPIEGSIDAGSIDRGKGTEPRFRSSCKGASRFLGLFEEIGIPATVFAEGQTLEHYSKEYGPISGAEIGLHGYAHEDYSKLAEDEGRNRIKAGIDIVKDVSGTYPISFRAPYMRSAPWLKSVLKESGFRYDSSEYADPTLCHPFYEDGLIEVPVFKKILPTGNPIGAYLWPMHEGRRDPNSYLSFAESFPEEGVLVISDHSWHIIESRARGMFSEKEVEQNLEDVRSVILGLLDLGFTPKAISELPSGQIN